MTDIVLAAGARTPFGDFGKSLRQVPLTDLAAHAAKASIQRSGLKADDIDHFVFGSTLFPDRDSLFGGRVIGIKAGLPEEMPALNVIRACGTGLQALISASQQIKEGQSRIALAGGAENYSRMPHVVTTARYGTQRGPMTLEDQLDWAYRCPFSQEYMGETAENLADDYQYEREPMDDWGYMSQRRAAAAIKSGFLARQIAPIEVPDGKGRRLFAVDEFPRPDVTREKLQKLKPAFRDGGRVTAGSSSGVTDGAAFMIVADRAQAEAKGLEGEALLRDWTAVGVPPRIMGAGPVPAIDKLLKRNDLEVSDIDYFEINEAFAVVNLHAEKQLGISRERTNLYGGGISIGHPPGATGGRMTITAMHHLAASRGRYGVISMCLGGGQGMAMLIENLKR
ncbi:MAG: thiolase family protein [Bradyrhizobium sp.]|uniref:thiolase family protein n=1 Tax=Bradyrhizobium sp. TaxID=376 RepID=UPI00272F75F9|nr:thiolase family protein [Bradyrhizobium sp.]MDP1868867.1 thiolase family protein [Bradyrhizobium sp.]